MPDSIFRNFNNTSAVPLREIPELPFPDFRKAILSAVHDGARISAFFPVSRENEHCALYAILTDPALRQLRVCRTEIGKTFESFTPELPAFHWFEREIFEQTGILPEGHPWLKPIRFQADAAGRRPEPGVCDYFAMQGTAVHEIAVGPVHAGVIEPGHFRFQCMGEDVFSLEIELGYQHRGIEKLLLGGPGLRTTHYLETAAGDTSATAAFCYASMLESMAGVRLSRRTEALRVIALELERIANHTGDLGAMAGDVAFLPAASCCGRIRGEFLNMTAQLCGNRFGRGMIQPGGMAFDPTETDITKLQDWLVRTRRDLEDTLALMFETPSVLDRFENTGCVTNDKARSIGMVGVAARASGLRLDARQDLPYGIYGKYMPEIPISESGDVFARAWIRRKELAASLDLVQTLLNELPDGTTETGDAALKPLPDTLAVSVAEAWRGELCHAMLTDSNGKFLKYKIVDPSFHNWFGLALALRNQQISDFPICNKSFNLSYCGHDL